MKYAPDVYAKAFWETKADPRRFLEVVAKNGDFPRINTILEAVEKVAVRTHGGRLIKLEFARPSSVSTKFKFMAKDHVRTSINPSLVAGVRITVDGEKELDMSLRRKLNKLFS